MNHLDFIMKVEDGDIEAEEYLDGLAAMIKDGTVWQLQGSWQRSAYYAVEMEFISPEGDVLRYPEPV